MKTKNWKIKKWSTKRERESFIYTHHHHYYYSRRRRRRTMFLNVLLLLLLVLLGGTGKASSSCSSYQSGCNRPKQRFASSTLGNHDDDVSITFRQTPNFPATMRNSVEKGVELAQSFLGKVSDVDVFMYEAQNASAQNPSAYEEINGLCVVRGDAGRSARVLRRRRGQPGESDERGE